MPATKHAPVACPQSHNSSHFSPRACFPQVFILHQWIGPCQCATFRQLLCLLFMRARACNVEVCVQQRVARLSLCDHVLDGLRFFMSFSSSFSFLSLSLSFFFLFFSFLFRAVQLTCSSRRPTPHCLRHSAVVTFKHCRA